MAVAVAAALAAPAVALAQGSSVQIYGGLSVSGEFAEAKGADTSLAPAGNGSSIRGGNLGGGYTSTGVNQPSRTRTQAAGSNFGLRGREDLGNGLYMGFQAEASIAMGGVTAVGASGSNGLFAGWRNSGVWLGGRWGEVGLGIWDLPFNMNQTTGAGHAAYANASTSMSAGLLGGGISTAGGGTQSGQDFAQQCPGGAATLVTTPTGTATITTQSGSFSNGSPSTCFAMATSFHRRQSNQIWYQSPTFAGFRGRVSYGATSGGTGNATADGANFPSSVKAALWGANVSYTLGGLYAGIGYEKHDDYIATAARLTPAGFALGGTAATATQASTLALIPIGSRSTNGISGDDSDGWNFNLRYTFGFGLSLGAYYETIKWDMNYSGNVTGNTTKLERDAWRLDAAYQLGAHTFGVQYGYGGKLDGQVVGGNFNGDGTKVDMWIFGYGYSLSKRSSVFAYYTMVDNETNARASGIVFGGIGPNAGGDPKYYGVGLRHLF
jgi:predicted porin